MRREVSQAGQFKAELTVERLRELLDYDPATGNLTWKVKRRGPVKPGHVVAYRGPDGYVQTVVDGKKYKGHRLIWFYVYGVWPTNVIDHIDGDRANNRIANLRDVVDRVNQENRRRPDCDNRTGLLGVTPHGRGFMAQIVVKGRHHYLGTHETAEQAHEAYVTAKRQLHEGCTL